MAVIEADWRGLSMKSVTIGIMFNKCLRTDFYDQALNIPALLRVRALYVGSRASQCLTHQYAGIRHVWYHAVSEYVCLD